MNDYSCRIEPSDEVLKLRNDTRYIAGYRFFGVSVVVMSNASQAMTLHDALYQAFKEEPSAYPDYRLYILLDEEQKSSMPHGPLHLRRGQIVYEAAGEFREWRTPYSPMPPFLLPPLVDGLFYIHAGAVSVNDRALIMPANSRAGKTTLTMALIDKGCKLLSDEFVIVDPVTLQVYPFPRATNARAKTVQMFDNLTSLLVEGSRFCDSDGTPLYVLPMDKLYPGCVGEPSKVSHIVFPKYEPSKKTQLIPLSRSMAVMRMLQNSMKPSLRDIDRAVDVLTRLVREAGCYSLLTSEIKDATTVLIELMSNGQDYVPVWESHRSVHTAYCGE